MDASQLAQLHALFSGKAKTHTMLCAFHSGILYEPIEDIKEVELPAGLKVPEKYSQRVPPCQFGGICKW